MPRLLFGISLDQFTARADGRTTRGGWRWPGSTSEPSWGNWPSWPWPCPRCTPPPAAASIRGW